MTILQRLRSGSAELAIVAAGNLAQALGTFAGVKALTTLLTPAQYGELALASTLAALAHVLVFMPLMNAQGRFLPAARERGTLPAHLRAIRGLLRRLWAALGAAALVGAAIAFAAAGARWAALALLAGSFAATNGAGLVHGTALGALRQRRPVALLQALDAFARPLFAVLLVLAVARDAVAAQLGVALGSLASFVAWRAAARRQPVLRDARESADPPIEQVLLARNEAIAFALPFVGSAVLIGVASFADRWTLEGLFGPEQVGLYAALFQIGASPPALLCGVLGSFALPVAYERAGSLQDAQRTREAVRFLVRTALAAALLALPWIAACAFLGPELVRLLSAEAYAAHAGDLWLFAVAGTALGAGQIVLAVAQVVQRPKANLIPWAINAALTLSLSLLLGRAHGVAGVVWALVLSNGAHLVTSAVLARVLQKAS